MIDQHFTANMIDVASDSYRVLFESAIVPRLRTYREFLEQELRIPKGDLKGFQWRADTQPFAGLILQEIAANANRWPRLCIIGCVQSGKTLTFFVGMVLYYLFELGETIVVGVPQEEMARDKWATEILPAIKASRFKSYLIPKRGGSTDTWEDEIEFANGARLKWMTGRANDEKRSGYTARVVIITEADKMDTAGVSSRETDPIRQMEARAASFGLLSRRVVMECTVSHEEGRIWVEYLASTQSKIVSPCVHCGEFVCPDREQLLGWQEARNEVEAFEQAYFACPLCAGVLRDRDRIEMNRLGRVLHAGQLIDRAGVIAGDPPNTFTAGFRWHAWHNLFWSIGEIAREEWIEANRPETVDAGRNVQQFYWSRPWKPDSQDRLAAQIELSGGKRSGVDRGVLPTWAQVVTVGVDVGDHWCHWVLTGWSPDATGAVVDYGMLAVDGDPEAEIARKLGSALTKWLEHGWPTMEGGRRTVDVGWIDAGHRGDLIRAICRTFGQSKFIPLLGRGFGQHHIGKYNSTTSGGNVIVKRFAGGHYKQLKIERQLEVELDVDHWKSWTIRRINTPAHARGSLVLFDADPHVHKTFVKHLEAEYEHTVFDQKTGKPVTKWEKVRKQNHYLDALTYSCAAAGSCGVQLIDAPVPAKPVAKQTTEANPAPEYNGMPWAVTDRT